MITEGGRARWDEGGTGPGTANVDDTMPIGGPFLKLGSLLAFHGAQFRTQPIIGTGVPSKETIKMDH